MGYDSKIYVVSKSTAPLYNGQGKNFAQIIATYDICVFPPFQRMFTQPTDCYIYADDGNTQILTDKYGQPLTEARIDEVVSCLENLSNEDKAYRRVPPLLAMLKAFRDDEKVWESLAVLHYGH